MPLARIAWITAAGACAIAAILLLVNGYNGYSAVLAVIGLSAAVNLLGGSEHPKDNRPDSAGPP
jgi:hypothetical protein